MNILRPLIRRQRGAAAVEFALVAMLFFTLLFGMLEVARVLFVFNTVQEVTRRAAREAALRWTTEQDAIKTYALFGRQALPGAPELSAANISIVYLKADGLPVVTEPDDPSDNLSACGDSNRTESCIYSVQVTVSNVTYSPIFSLLGFVDLQLPASQVTIHAESMGFET